jgi:phage terminase large subunit
VPPGFMTYLTEESILIKSTYRDNPFLPDSIKKQIEDLKRTDEAMYQIYALGEKAISKSNIYSRIGHS